MAEPDVTPPPLVADAPPRAVPNFMGDAPPAPATGDGFDNVLRQLPEMTKKIGKVSGADETEKALGATLERYKARAAEPKPALPDDPKFGAMPDRPDTTLKDSTKAFQSDATILSIFGSLLTRAPLTSALNAASGAMKGYQQGNLDQAHQLEKKFKDDMDKAIQQNRTELDKYTAALTKRGASMQDRSADLEAIAAEFRDEHVLGLVKAGKFDDAVKILQAREAAAARAAQNQFMNQYRQDSLNARTDAADAAERARQDRLDETRRAALQRETDRQSSPGYQEGKAIEELVAKGTPRTEAIRQVREAASPASGRAVAKDAEKRAAAAENYDLALGQIDDLITKAKAGNVTGLGGTGRSWLETAEGITGVGTGATPASDFRSSLDTLKLELPKLLTGTSRSAKDERSKIDTILRGTGPGDTMEKTVNSLNQVKALLQARRDGIKSGQEPVEGSAASDGQDKSSLLDDARSLLARGAPRAAVDEVLRAHGIDPSELP